MKKVEGLSDLGFLIFVTSNDRVEDVDMSEGNPSSRIRDWEDELTSHDARLLIFEL